MAKKDKHVSETPATQWLKAHKVSYTEHVYDYVDHGGTAESASRMATAVKDLWRYVPELFEDDAVDTAAAAHYLNRRPQTLWGWDCMEKGPLRPRRIMGRLAWSVAEIRAVLGVA